MREQGIHHWCCLAQDLLELESGNLSGPIRFPPLPATSPVSAQGTSICNAPFLAQSLTR